MYVCTLEVPNFSICSFLSRQRGKSGQSRNQQRRKPRTDNRRIGSQKDRKRIAKRCQTDSRMANLSLFHPFTTRLPSICHPFAIRLPSICHPFAIRLLYVCNPFTTIFCYRFRVYESGLKFLKPHRLYTEECPFKIWISECKDVCAPLSSIIA